MTVSSEDSRKTFAGNGATTSFSTSPMVFFASSDLTAYVVTTATGVVVKTLVENTDYTVSGGSGSTGTLDLSAGSAPYGAPATGTTLVIVRELPVTQATDLVNNDGSDAEVIEDALDRLVMIAQEHDQRIDRSFALADSDVSGASTAIPTPAVSKLIGWDATGLALTNYASSAIIASIVPTAFMETVLDDADADAVFQTLVAGATAETAPAAGDIVLLSDVSLTPDDGRKMTLANLFNVINDLTAETAIATDDVLAVYDTSGAATDKMTVENFLKVVNALTEDTAPLSSADYLLTYDASASGPKKVLLENFGIKAGTATTTTSGATHDYSTGLSGAKRITVAFMAAGLSGTDNILVQIGTGGAATTSGYVSGGNAADGAGGTDGATSTAGFIVPINSDVVSGTLTLTLANPSSNLWLASGTVKRHGTTVTVMCAGTVTLAGAFDFLRFTRTGTDTWDAGSVNVIAERG